MTVPLAPITLPGPAGPLPALALGAFEAARAAIILRYGLGGRMAVQVPEAERLAAAGFAVLIPEAPHHGLREDGFLEHLAAASGPGARSLFLDLVEQAADETRLLVDHLAALGVTRFVDAGISMGGFIALSAPVRDARIEAVVAFAADPVWDDRPGSPHRRPEAWSQAALFTVTSSEDETVPPGPMRAFVRTLAARHGASGRFRCLEYAGGHRMDPAAWNDAWSQATAWLGRRFD